MVKLSEDPARHAHLSESIVSGFFSSDQPKSAGGAVDFTQFADVMACQMLFKAEGLAASSSDRARKLRRMEEAVEDRKARRLEGKRAAQAKQKLAESSKRVKINRHPAQVLSSLHETWKLPISRVDAVPNVSGVCEEDAEASQSKVRLKKEAIRQASAVLGVNYVPPSTPSTTSPATIIADSLRGRTWYIGRSTSVNNVRGSGGGGGGGIALTKDDCSRGKVAARAALGGFVRYPPVRRLRLRPQRLSPGVGLSRNRGMPSSGVVVGDPDDPDTKGIKAFGVTSCRKDAIMRRTPMCSRGASAGLPSWASCHNSAWDPGKERNGVLGKSAAGGELVPAEPESFVRCGTGEANAAVPEQEEAPVAVSPVGGRCMRRPESKAE
eukprot:g7382.t1